MSEEQAIQLIEQSEIVEQAKNMHKEGYRLIQLCCTKSATEMDIIYTYEKISMECKNFKVNVNVGDELPSISDIFFGAFLYENEVHDLYGVKFKGMAVDFKGTFYETSVKYPFSADAETKE